MHNLKKLRNHASYLSCTEDLLSTEQVTSMRQWKHHMSVSTYDHCLFVSYMAFRFARRLRCDYRAAARMGLLHDLYLYNSHDSSAYDGSHCFNHPIEALKNARSLLEMSEKEENIIVSHMWPLAKEMPRSKEALIVNLADKICASLEGSYLFHLKPIRCWLPNVPDSLAAPI